MAMNSSDKRTLKLPQGWEAPPVLTSHSGEERRVGVELEFAGVEGDQAARIVSDLFGGDVKQTDQYRWHIKNTSLGEFEVELDVSMAHKAEDAPESEIRDFFREIVGAVGHEIAPFEIVCPPVSLSGLPELESLIDALRKHGAEGTGDQLLHAFGLQLNPEVASLEPDYILCHLQAFLLLEPWLRVKIKVDATRRILPFTDPFPKDYIAYLLRQDNVSGTGKIMDDYIAFNPTRNRSLDMLPLFAFLDEKRVRNTLDDPRIKSRPTFHYRLPNSMISQKNWGIATEWNRWVEVERLAADKGALKDLTLKYFDNEARLIAHDWAGIVEKWYQERS